MKILETTFKTTNTLHHAYFFVGDTENIVSNLISFLKNTVKFKIVGNPDFWHRKFDVFTIDEARSLTFSQEEKDFGGTGGLKVFIIQTNSITEQAQNALLKIFEEPTSGTHFFILMPQDTLLPTLRSRLQVILYSESAEGSLAEGNLLQKSLLERLMIVKEITKEIKDEEKTKQDAILLLNQVEVELYSTFMKAFIKQKRNNKLNALKVCQLTRDALNDNGAPIKIILENLMISI